MPRPFVCLFGFNLIMKFFDDLLKKHFYRVCKIFHILVCMPKEMKYVLILKKAPNLRKFISFLFLVNVQSRNKQIQTNLANLKPHYQWVIVTLLWWVQFGVAGAYSQVRRQPTSLFSKKKKLLIYG